MAPARRGFKRCGEAAGLVTFHLVALGWLLFRADSLASAGRFLAGLVSAQQMQWLAYYAPGVLFTAALVLGLDWLATGRAGWAVAWWDGDASGYGEGQTYLGNLTADANGNFSGTITVSGVTYGNNITGTATDGSNNTSEFGAYGGVSGIFYSKSSAAVPKQKLSQTMGQPAVVYKGFTNFHKL